MRMIFIAVPLALLAACNQSGAPTNNAATANAAAPEAAGNAAKPAEAGAAAPEAAADAAKPSGTDTAAMDPRRAGEIAECIQDVAREVPPGTDVNAFCGCAVDRMQSTGAGERDAMNYCAAQMGIQPR